MDRHHSWPEDLIAYIESRRHASFEWGTNDCVQFVVGGVKAMTGTDISEGFPAYSTEKQALKIIGGVGGMLGLAEKAGLKSIPPAFAKRGSVVLVELDGRDTYGLVVDGCWCAPGADGLVFRPMSEAKAAFEV